MKSSIRFFLEVCCALAMGGLFVQADDAAPAVATPPAPAAVAAPIVNRTMAGASAVNVFPIVVPNAGF